MARNSGLPTATSSRQLQLRGGKRKWGSWTSNGLLLSVGTNDLLLRSCTFAAHWKGGEARGLKSGSQRVVRLVNLPDLFASWLDNHMGPVLTHQSFIFNIFTNALIYNHILLEMKSIMSQFAGTITSSFNSFIIDWHRRSSYLNLSMTNSSASSSWKLASWFRKCRRTRWLRWSLGSFKSWSLLWLCGRIICIFACSLEVSPFFPIDIADVLKVKDPGDLVA